MCSCMVEMMCGGRWSVDGSIGSSVAGEMAGKSGAKHS